MDNEKSKGLGDTIKKVTSAVGIKQCGSCKKRQATLNKMFPYKTADHKVEHDKQKTAQEQARANQQELLSNMRKGL
tara:strand:- start:1350 stop:1577 length:228 start_codon:yes stop_codon:yes gene_type:complete